MLRAGGLYRLFDAFRAFRYLPHASNASTGILRDALATADVSAGAVDNGPDSITAVEEVQIQVNFRHHRHAFRMKLGRWRRLRDGQDAERFSELLVASIESQLSTVNPPANGFKTPHHD